MFQAAKLGHLSGKCGLLIDLGVWLVFVLSILVKDRNDIDNVQRDKKDAHHYVDATSHSNRVHHQHEAREKEKRITGEKTLV